MNATIRKIQARDEARWRVLWDGYCRFYELKMSQDITELTWKRIMDPASPVHACVAERPGDGVIGICNYILHENTWTLTPVCYLEDLFVDPATRAQGAGKQLIDWLVAEMKAQNWSRIYWRTKEDNYRARGLYDKYTAHSGFLTYVVYNSSGSQGIPGRRAG
jgi:GNAT superfamily N-acetyltransferase